MKKIFPKVFTDYKKFLRVAGCDDDSKDYNFEACYCDGYIWIKDIKFSHFAHEIIHHLFYLFGMDFVIFDDFWDNLWIDLFRSDKDNGE